MVSNVLPLMLRTNKHVKHKIKKYAKRFQRFLEKCEETNTKHPLVEIIERYKQLGYFYDEEVTEEEPQSNVPYRPMRINN